MPTTWTNTPVTATIKGGGPNTEIKVTKLNGDLIQNWKKQMINTKVWGQQLCYY